MKALTRRQYQRLAAIKAQLATHVSLKLATALRKDYFRLEAIKNGKTADFGLSNDELAMARTTLERRIQERMKTVLSTGLRYSLADVVRDSARFYTLSRKWEKAQDGGPQLTPGEDVELARLTTYRLVYEHSPEGIARLETQEREQAAQTAELIEELLVNGQ